MSFLDMLTDSPCKTVLEDLIFISFTPPHLLYVSLNAVAIDKSIPLRYLQVTSKHLKSGCLASTIDAQQAKAFSQWHSKIEMVHCSQPSRVSLAEVSGGECYGSEPSLTLTVHYQKCVKSINGFKLKL